jgi:hypothetical protein
MECPKQDTGHVQWLCSGVVVGRLADAWNLQFHLPDARPRDGD